MQVMVLAGAGVAIGLALGQAVPFAVHLLPAGLLPLDLAPGIQPAALAIAAACGILTALACAVWPLARARDISAAGMFRSLIGRGSAPAARGDLAWLGAEPDRARRVRGAGGRGPRARRHLRRLRGVRASGARRARPAAAARRPRPRRPRQRARRAWRSATCIAQARRPAW